MLLEGLDAKLFGVVAPGWTGPDGPPSRGTRRGRCSQDVTTSLAHCSRRRAQLVVADAEQVHVPEERPEDLYAQHETRRGLRYGRGRATARSPCSVASAAPSRDPCSCCRDDEPLTVRDWSSVLVDRHASSFSLRTCR